ncbi:unnamed protein product [Paramecium primaurelia]|uniref:Uncharacterized protein n=1 Tax=Paramecium primaurelia TaxID=5886 RepID=A0A8S1Q9F1_PARPR|nr:unnamed protein product [Paramecium primaurelia]
MYKDVIDKDICFFKCDQSMLSIGIHYLYDDDEFPSKYKKYVNQSFQFCKSKILGFKICQYFEGKKQGECNIVYNNMKIGGGEFNQNGCKQGFWTKFYKYLTPQIYIIYQGEYNNGQKINKWNYEWIEPLTRNCKIIGGGIYDQYEKKQGEWTDLSNNFKQDFQVIFTGQYRNGIKQGQWNTLFRRNQKTRFKIVCGGLYDEEQVKQGQWTELSSYFSEKCKIFWCGEYKGGKKQGKWTIKQFEEDQFEKLTQIIGGGEYDINSFKIGIWTELHDNYNENCQALNEGQYHNGKKINKWIIKYRYSDRESFQIIGGGVYDEKGRKQGKWEELAKNFCDSCQLIRFANYQSDIIQGQHMIKLRKISGSNLQLEDLEIGEFKLGKKEGNWIEIADNFKQYLKNIKDILKYFIKGCTIKGLRKEYGKYNLGNNPIRSLMILGVAFMKKEEKYNHGLILMMNLAELVNQYIMQTIKKEKRLIFVRQNIEGFKRMSLKEWQGEYDGNGMKDKEWVQPNENFWSFNLSIDHGQYRNGVKIKQWQIIRDTNLIIEQGDYNQDGHKHGIWVEFDDRGYKNLIANWQGTYDQGKKTGEWIWEIFQKHINSWKSVGNFHYDDEEMRNGICTEIDQNYLLNHFTYIGTYSNGRKVGKFKEKLNKI